MLCGCASFSQTPTADETTTISEEPTADFIAISRLVALDFLRLRNPAPEGPWVLEESPVALEVLIGRWPSEYRAVFANPDARKYITMRNGIFVDRRTGRQKSLISFTIVSLVAEDAYVIARTVFGALGAESQEYRLRRVGDRWKIVSRQRGVTS